MHSRFGPVPAHRDLQSQPGHTRGKSQDSNSISQPAKLLSDSSVSLALPCEWEAGAVVWEYSCMKE